ncbi:MAG: hypothetical protein IT345_10535 [Trueperaceae bacterium]|nr:hypothetical protein [Trueperaceae bacterium]
MTIIVGCYVEHTPGGHLSNGQPSGLGGVTRFGVRVSRDAIRWENVGPLYESPKDAYRAADRLEQKIAREEAA